VSRLRNYGTFRRAQAESRVPLLTVELAFHDEPFELPAEGDVLRVRGGDVLWQKERLLQIGAERLVEQGFRAIVFLDADILFESSAWPDVVCSAVERHPVAQCFAESVAEYSERAIVESSAVRLYRETGSLSGRAGFAWAMRAELVQATGLYQHCVVGGGDSALLLAALGLASSDGAWGAGLYPHDFIRFSGPAMLAHYRAWADRILAASGGEVGYANLRIASLAHGARRDRGYRARQDILVGFDPARDVACEPGAGFTWTASGERFREPVAAYFRARNEDGDRSPGAAC
jgi:hypothetical protein